MNKKQGVIGLVATVMIANAAFVDVRPVYAVENLNLAKGCTVNASSYEVDSTSPSKAVDGDIKTRWGTAQNKADNEWIEINLGGEKTVRQININFERTDDAQNILGYKIELEEGGQYKEVYRKSTKAKQNEIIQLDKDHQATKVKVTVLSADGGTINWKNVGINEIEVYSKIVEKADATPNKNHMANATVTASSSEANTLSPDKVKDGSTEKANRWASDYETPTTNIWLNTKFAGLTLVKELKIHFFERDVAPIPSNVKSFDIKYKDKDGVEKLAKSFTNTKKGDGYNNEVVVKFDEPIEAKELKLCNFVAEASSWNNVSIAEMEVYSNEQTAQKATLNSVVSSIESQSKTIEADVNTLDMPAVPAGFTVRINGADLEQIIGADGKIVHPLVDKNVKVSYVVTETSTGKEKKTADVDYVVKGINEQSANKNTKPTVIPEIQEWHSNSTEKISVNSLKTVTYTDDKLKSVVDEFVRDYKDFTGINLTVKKGASQANAFNFELKAPDTLLGDEGYTMDIQKDRINVASVHTTGNMYGMQTILQMYKEDNEGYKIGKMRDYPRFKTRGFLFDVARKPVSLDMMKEVARTMRYYKMNDFQTHLSDNYIFLEQYGKGDNENEAFKAYEAFRLESGLSNDKGETPTAKDYSISKKDFREFIQGERALGMNVVPEIDVPAHATSFTKVWPELMVQNKVSPLNRNRPLIDHLDVSKKETKDKIKEIFDDYTKGANPVFDGETTVHIGADEFLSNYTAYRGFVNDLVPHLKETNTVRMWGGLTWIKDNPVTQIKREAIDNVEMNLWSADWADGIEMYDMGYKLINTIDDFGYMVPNGNKGRANAYGDLLNVNRIFNQFEANKVRVRGGSYKYVPAGDDQMLGAAFALWSDNIDKSASGLSESDLYWRFFDALPFYAEKTWAATGKEKGSADALAKVAQDKGTGPNTNPYYKENKKGENYESYDFNNGLKDSSENKRDLKEGKNTEIKDNALVLKDGASYVTSPIKELGNGNKLSFDIKLNKPAKPGDILFESDADYGTHDIRIMEDGKLGFTRELYNYYFDYELPVGKKVNIAITTAQQKTSLYVNGEYVCDAKGKFIHNDMVKKDNITHSTFALPLERIGSKTETVSAVIDNVVVTEKAPEVDLYNKASWTGKAESETPTAHGGQSEGIIGMAFDNKPSTIWHSDWSQATKDKVPTTSGAPGTGKGADGSIWTEISFDKAYEINQVSFTPRQDSNSGQVTKASLYIQTEKNGEWVEVAKDQTFEANKSEKTFTFDTQNVYGFKFVASESNDGWVAISEFNIANKEVTNNTYTVYVEAEKGGKVSGGQEVKAGKSVTVTATPNRGYVFKGWYRPNGEKVSDKAEYTFKVNGNTALIAKFEKSSEADVKIKDVQKLDDLTVVKGTTLDALNLPKKVSITLENNETEEVDVTWNKASYKANECGTYVLEGTLTLPEGVVNPDGLKVVVKVTVENKKYTVVVDSDQNMGTVSMDKEDGIYEEGSNVTVTAKANKGYEFVNWTDENGREVSTSNPYTFEATTNTTLKANFKKVEVTPAKPSSQDILDDLLAGNKVQSVVAKGQTQFVLPEVPEGYSITITKVSPEGIISLDGKVTTPKKDADVIVTITVTDAEGKTASHDFTVKVIGLNEVDKETPKDPEMGKDTPKDPTQDKKPAKTGDATSIASWISMMTVAGAMLLKRKKRS